MSVADKLTYLNDTKSLLREAINAAGGNLTQETPFREYVGGWLRDQSASLTLDFSKQQYVAKDKVSMFPDRLGFEDIVTFTRSSGGGRFNAQGQYEWVGPDEPRIDYDPLTGECLGLLVEEQRTNLLKYSSDFAKAPWATYKDQSASTLVEYGAAIAPDGTASANKISFIGSGNNLLTQDIYSLTAGASYTLSVWLRGEVGGEKVQIDFRNTVSGGISGALVTLTTSWQRFVVTVTNDAGTTRGFQFRRSRSAWPAGGVFYAWGAQLEAGDFPTSYIPTEGAQVTRTADIARVNDLAPWFNPNEGTIGVEFQAPTRTQHLPIFQFVGGSYMRAYVREVSGSIQCQINGGGGAVMNTSISRAERAVTKLAMSYSLQGTAASVDGAVTRPSGPRVGATVPNGLLLGGIWGVGSGYMNGFIRSIYYYPRKLPDSELQEITA